MCSLFFCVVAPFYRWAGFFTAIVLLVSYLKSSFGLDVAAYRSRAARMSVWGGLLAASLIVMGSSLRVFKRSECHGDTEDFCRRTKFGISCGVLGIAFSIGMVAMKLLASAAPLAVEFGSSIILTILNGFGVAYITSPSGPGSPIGNLYYSMWIAFLCSALLVAGCWEQRGAGAEANAANANNGDTHKYPDDTEVVVESLEDQI